MTRIALRTCVTAIAFTLLTSTAIGQVRSVAVVNKPNARTLVTEQGQANPTNATRARVTGQDSRTPTTGKAVSDPKLQAHAKSVSIYPSNKNSFPTINTDTDKTSLKVKANRARTVADISAKPSANNSASSPSNSGASAANSVTTAASQIYRIGVHDVLDIQLAGQSGKQSTLFTVSDGGVVEYPLAGGPIPAAGMTTAEVAELLRRRIKILDGPAVVVKVRDYASHPVTITGLVAAPGVKNLRREAVPLFTLLAEALILPEAARATISRQGRAPVVVELKDSNLASTPILPRDVIKVSGVPPGPTEFFFVGGEISAPGQKAFHAGITLTQAIMASGGTSRGAGNKVRVSRQGADGRLLTEEYNLRKIHDGKTPDPVLQKGDRIEVTGTR